MTDENNYKLRDHPEFPLDIDVPFAKVLRPELICSACNCVTPAGLKDGNDHVYCLKCAEVLTDCTNQFTCCICQWSGPKSSLEQKHKVVCQLVPVDCSFKQLGCGYKAARREMEIHEANSRHNGHNDLLVRKLCRLEKENEDRKHAFHEMLETVKGTYEDKIQHMQRNMALRMKQNDDNGQLEYRLTETEDTVERLNRELHLDPMTPGFEYVWKLQPYFALKAAAMASTEEISSGALYINTPGYRVEFTVGFTRPSSLTSSQHLSFKCRICSGEYDDMLPWPFQNKIILVLVNQQDERSRRCFELDTATAEHAADCFKKPVSDQRNPKFGYSQVIPVPLLENEKKGFLFQNCVVLKIVAPPLY
ncbi:hypothetical protein HPB49_025336 [Dermacentor silvarum]|uniref:Uncharacterized protein n=1 Tax=Dermacentor silvarum TaxID=543639 RepID=A0ACB8C6D3_DERSI|nr:hypothetical protein HPB49_025336 [Dermacentor silvarum]